MCHLHLFQPSFGSKDGTWVSFQYLLAFRFLVSQAADGVGAWKGGDKPQEQYEESGKKEGLTESRQQGNTLGGHQSPPVDKAWEITETQ